MGRKLACSIIAVFALAVFTAGPAFAQGGWALQSTPSTVAPADLEGVSCVSVNDCEAVGYAANFWLAEEWNGSSWTVQSQTAGRLRLLGVSCVSASFCEAVGYNTGTDSALADIWNGSSWVGQGVALSSVLYGVSCVSASFCEAVGQGYNGDVSAAYFNGVVWQAQSTPPTSGLLTSVSCVTASNCTAVGYGSTAFAEHWNGSTWSAENFIQQGAQSFPFSVSCGSAASCMAVGAIYSTGATYEYALAEVWNGSTWTVENGSSPYDQADFQGVSCVSASDCTAVGVYSTSEYGEYYTLGESWNGSGWTTQNTPDPSGAQLGAGLDGISCVSATDCTAVGGYEGSSYSDAQGFAEQWTG